MAFVFLLGPGSAKGASPGETHLQVRKDIAAIFESDGHRVTIMEKVPDIPGEDVIRKFDRLLRQGITDVVVYYPPLAEITSTQIELVMLAKQVEFVKENQIALVLVHHVSVLSIQRGKFRVLEEGSRTAYLNPVTQLKPRCVPWKDLPELYASIKYLSVEL